MADTVDEVQEPTNDDDLMQEDPVVSKDVTDALTTQTRADIFFGGRIVYGRTQPMNDDEIVRIKEFNPNSTKMLRKVGEMVEADAAQVVQKSIDAKNTAGKAVETTESAVFHKDALAIIAKSPFGAKPYITARLKYPIGNVLGINGDTTVVNCCLEVGSRLNCRVGDIVSYTDDPVTNELTIVPNAVNIAKYNITKKEFATQVGYLIEYYRRKQFNTLRHHMTRLVRDNSSKVDPPYVMVESFRFVRLQFGAYAHAKNVTSADYKTKSSRELWFDNPTTTKRLLFTAANGDQTYTLTTDRDEPNFIYHAAEDDGGPNVPITYLKTSYTELWFHDDILSLYGLSPYYIASHLGEDVQHYRSPPYSKIVCRTAMLDGAVNGNMLAAYKLVFPEADAVSRCFVGKEYMLRTTCMSSILTNLISYFITAGMSYNEQALYSARVQLSIMRNLENAPYDMARSYLRMIPGYVVPFDERLATYVSSLPTAATVTYKGVRATLGDMIVRPETKIDALGAVSTGAEAFRGEQYFAYKDPYVDYDIYEEGEYTPPVPETIEEADIFNGDIEGIDD